MARRCSGIGRFPRWACLTGEAGGLHASPFILCGLGLGLASRTGRLEFLLNDFEIGAASADPL